MSVELSRKESMLIGANSSKSFEVNTSSSTVMRLTVNPGPSGGQSPSNPTIQDYTIDVETRSTPSGSFSTVSGSPISSTDTSSRNFVTAGISSTTKMTVTNNGSSRGAILVEAKGYSGEDAIREYLQNESLSKQTNSIDGLITGDTKITDLLGSNLSVSSGSLTATGGGDQTLGIATTTLADGEFIKSRFRVPSDKTLEVNAVGVMNTSQNAPSGVKAEVIDETNSTTITSKNSKRSEGSPIASKSGAIDVSFKVFNDNGNGTTYDLSGYMEYKLA